MVLLGGRYIYLPPNPYTSTFSKNKPISKEENSDLSPKDIFFWAYFKGWCKLNYQDLLESDIYDVKETIRKFNAMNSEKHGFIQYLDETKLSDKSLEILVELTNHKLDYIRLDAIEILSSYDLEEDINHVWATSLLDSEPLIRVTAAEMVAEQNITQGVPILIKMLNDKSFLVRGYAAVSLSEMKAKKGEMFVKRKLRYEKNHWVKLNMLTALYNYGDKQKIKKILSYLEHKSYQIRCATANILSMIIVANNKKEAIIALETALVKEKTIAAKSSILSTLNQLKSE